MSTKHPPGRNGSILLTAMSFFRSNLLAVSLVGVALGQDARSNIPVLAYKLTPEWPLQARTAAGTPAGPWNLIQASAVAINAQGNVMVLHRGAHPILEFEGGGKFVRSWGDGMISEGKVVAVAPGFRSPGASGYSAVYGPAGCHSCGAPPSVSIPRETSGWWMPRAM